MNQFEELNQFIADVQEQYMDGRTNSYLLLVYFKKMQEKVKILEEKFA